MDSGRSVVAEQLREGNVVDLVAVLSDPATHPWVWQPFGPDEPARRLAIAAALCMAECQFALVEGAEMTDSGTVMIYTDQINLTVPAGYGFMVMS